MPRSPAIVSIGSPGMRRLSTNTSSVIPMKVGTTRLRRVKMNRSMILSSTPAWRRKKAERLSPLRRYQGLLLEVDAVEGVPAERRELEVDYLLADRLQLHRMRDGEPGRLFLEDDLRLLIELGALGLVGEGLRLHDELVERLVAELGDIGAAGLRRVATEQRVQEVVGI